MANPCFLINLNFAKLFLKNFPDIYSTSDAYIHSHIPEKYKIKNYSIYPFCIGQHSYGNKINKFPSSITSNQIESKNFSNINSISEEQNYRELKKFGLSLNNPDRLKKYWRILNIFIVEVIPNN